MLKHIPFIHIPIIIIVYIFPTKDPIRNFYSYKIIPNTCSWIPNYLDVQQSPQTCSSPRFCLLAPSMPLVYPHFLNFIHVTIKNYWVLKRAWELFVYRKSYMVLMITTGKLLPLHNLFPRTQSTHPIKSLGAVCKLIWGRVFLHFPYCGSLVSLKVKVTMCSSSSSRKSYYI